jgi:tetratricopeptide (TPR) repeat protein
MDKIKLQKTAVLLILLAVLGGVFTKYTLPRKHNIVRGLVYRAWQLSTVGMHRPALALYNLAVSVEPSYYQTYVFRGDTYLALQNVQKAEEDYIRTLELKPGDQHAISSLSMLYTINNDFKSAIEGYEKMLKVDLSQTDYYYCQIGLNYHFLKDYENALLAFEKVQNPKPKYSNVYSLRATTYSALHRYELAEAECEKALALDPSQQYNFTSMLDMIRRNKERYINNIIKLDILKNSLAENPTDVNKYFDLAGVYHEIGEPENVIKCYTAIIDINSNSWQTQNAYYNRGCLYYDDLGDTLAAIEDMKTAAMAGERNAKNWLKEHKISF